MLTRHDPEVKRMSHTWPAALAVALAAMWCTGCPQMAIVTGATTAAGAIADDRSLDQQAADLDVKVGIEQALVSNAPALASAVNVDVYLGRVMLTGVVGTWSARRYAEALARQAAGDHEIYNDIEVATGSGFADSATNFAINKDLGLRLIGAEGLASQSFQHRVVNGTAFIMGQVTDPSQIVTARQVALQTRGVQNVVTHIVVR
ncbi:MAG: BON domain-containing protein [Candidatus Binatia bacterium]